MDNRFHHIQAVSRVRRRFADGCHSPFRFNPPPRHDLLHRRKRRRTSVSDRARPPHQPASNTSSENHPERYRNRTLHNRNLPAMLSVYTGWNCIFFRAKAALPAKPKTHLHVEHQRDFRLSDNRQMRQSHRSGYTDMPCLQTGSGTQHHITFFDILPGLPDGLSFHGQTLTNFSLFPSTRHHSCRITVSAPSGNGAPVKIRAASPGPSPPPGCPAGILCRMSSTVSLDRLHH